jgi:hypothetical protein
MILSNVTRRRLIGGLAAGVSAVSVISPNTFISSARAQSAQKTFVLIGGAFYGAWCWHHVTDRLEKQGHKIYALTLTGLAERSNLLSKDINSTRTSQTSQIWSNGKTSLTFALLPIRTPDVPHPARLSALETVSRLSSGLMQ